jgi:Uma2 family endonuclease
MATAASEKIYTPEDLLRITNRPCPDLVDGRLVERPKVGLRTSSIAATIAALLVTYARAHLPGVVSGADGGFQIFPGHPNRVRFPDAAFTRRDRLAGGQPPEGHCRVVPELIVEVVSPNDNADKLAAKIADFLAAGVPMIWVVQPAARLVQVIRGDRTSVYLAPGEAIDGGDVLPGFRCDVAQFFEGLDG